MNNTNLSPVFIVSSGRSGTTLLRAILNASEQIYIPHESDFFARAYPFYKDQEKFSDEDYNQIVKLFMKASQENGWGMDKDYLLNYLQNASPSSFSEVNRAIYDAYMKIKDLPNLQWGIKHPVLIASVDKIFEVFPKCKIVHIVRDGRDVCLSYQKVHKGSLNKFGPKSPITSALYWIDGLKRIEENDCEQLYELRYEDVLAQSKHELRGLCEFLDIEFTEDLCERYSTSALNRNLLLSQHENTIHGKVKGGIDASNQGKFLTQMPKIDRFVFELLAMPYLIKYRYSIEFPFLSNLVLDSFRQSAYTLARQFNNWRYKRRAVNTFKNLG
ncbi:Sulfotransferase domain superfamily [Synechococcus sp. PCC 7335]|uniref:sulfotransferase family protein n=1 Tax=Synechococcus sp. (strain ATCC 29403 / PCC 7335) TaxID=91464 RepID=UPI00017ED993|nr:sulfotransferase [Synechococcus sp. PCC 7335]EDX86027.1 Sulfotransferase domain superfamily [Synechococcus sp. PCC 7335]